MAASVVDLTDLTGRVLVVVQELGIGLIKRIGQELGFFILEGSGQMLQGYRQRQELTEGIPTQVAFLQQTAAHAWEPSRRRLSRTVRHRPEAARSTASWRWCPVQGSGTGRSDNPSGHFRLRKSYPGRLLPCGRVKLHRFHGRHDMDLKTVRIVIFQVLCSPFRSSGHHGPCSCPARRQPVLRLPVPCALPA